ncbi:MAG: hypothetical protein EOP60_05975 [Sphingomonadales bacterium]|nr:MAG: hypothetical protein EOP60_05975 [Sphingomonadales bacterium]
MTDDNRTDSRSDIEQAVQARADAVDAANGGAETSALEPTRIKDGVGGTAGEVKNQGQDQQ